MKKSYRWAIGCLVLALGASCAQATLIIKVTSGASTSTITDQGAGDQLVGPSGIDTVQFVGSVGSYSLNVIAAIESSGEIDLQATDRRNSTNSLVPITITAYDVGFTYGESNNSILTATGNGTFTKNKNGDNVTYNVFLDPMNRPAYTTVGPPVTATGSMSATFTGPSSSIPSPYTVVPGPVSDALSLVPGQPYSLTTVLTIDASASSTTTFTGSASVVPEPAMIGFVGIASGLVAMRRRR